MLKCLVIVICAVSFTSTVFCAPGYDIREKQSWEDGSDLFKTDGALRRRRQNWGTVDIEVGDASTIDLTKLKNLQNKELSRLLPVNDQSNPGKDFQLEPETNTEVITQDGSYIIYKVKSSIDSCNSNQDCTRHKNSSPNSLPDDNMTRDTYYDGQDYSYDRDKYWEHSENRHPPPPPPPDDGRPPPPPPHHHPPPPPHHGPPPPHHGPPPPPPYHHPPPPHHYPPPPPPHHHPPPPPHDYRSNYYDGYHSSYYDSYYRRPQPPPYGERSRVITDDRQTRQSSYYDRPRHDGRSPQQGSDWPPPPPPPHHHQGPPPPPPPHHHEGPPPPPPPHHHDGPPPPHHGRPPPPYNGGPPHRGGSPDRYDDPPYDQRPPRPPPEYRMAPDRRRPYDNRQPHERGNENNQYPQYYERQSYSNQDRSQNEDQGGYQTTSTTEAGSNQYLLDVRFADGAPTQKIMEAIRSNGGETTTSRLPPFVFQAAAVMPEE